MAGDNNRLDMTAVEIQQEYFETIGDVDWELYEKKDRKYLLQKVAVALCGSPSNEGNLVDGVEEIGSELKLQGYEARDEDTCMKVFNKILEQAKYSHNGENLIISVLRVVCVIPKREIKLLEITPKDYWVNLDVKNGDSVHILVFHVFSIRKCISMNSEVKGCKIFIDHDARVYESWSEFLTENKLPKCVMVVPKHGQYKGSFIEGCDVPQVQLTVQASPALGIGVKVLNVADNVSTAANVGALVAIVGSLFAAPVAAPVMVSAAIGVGAASGVYSIGRSIGHLVDRAQHEQTIGLDNSEARSSWINIMISTVGLSFSAAGKLLTWAAASGRNVKILMSALDFLKFTNLATGFIGVANGLGDMIYKYAKYGETPSSLEVFQFTTSALFLGIGVMSNQTAQEIVKDAQANKINEIRDSLSSNNKRKIFDKITAETRRVKGTIEGNSDVIRALDKIKNKDDFFGKLKSINKSVNKNKVRISLAPDGKVLVNNQHRVHISKLYNIRDAGRNKLFARYGRAQVTTKNAPTRIYPSYTVANSSRRTIKEFALTCTIRPEEIIKISAFFINLSKVEQDFVIELLSSISEQLYDGFLLICTELIISLIPAELKIIESVYPNWKRQLVFFVFHYLRSKITVNGDDTEFVAVLKTYIRDGRIDKQALLNLKTKLLEFFAKKKEEKYAQNKTWDAYDDYVSNIHFYTLQVGEKITLGSHTILVKQITVENLEMWLQNHTQEKCDLFMELCFKIIEILTASEMKRLNAVNPDEDIIMRVSLFLLDKFEEYISGPSNVEAKAILAKYNLMKWCFRQRLRTQYNCKKCKGVTYFQKS